MISSLVILLRMGTLGFPFLPLIINQCIAHCRAYHCVYVCMSVCFCVYASVCLDVWREGSRNSSLKVSWSLGNCPLESFCSLQFLCGFVVAVSVISVVAIIFCSLRYWNCFFYV